MGKKYTNSEQDTTTNQNKEEIKVIVIENEKEITTSKHKRTVTFEAPDTATQQKTDKPTKDITENNRTETYYQTAWNVVAVQNQIAKEIEVRSFIKKLLIDLQRIDKDIVKIPLEKNITEENPVIYNATNIPNNRNGLTKYLQSPQLKNNKVMF
jgi:hypothetical protein